MELDKVAAELRRRNGVESIDLGVLLGRRFWLAIFFPWCLLVVPVLVITQVLIALVTTLWFAVLVGWWLKPLFDRVTLHVVSRGFFGSTPSTRDTIRAVSSGWWSKDAILDLTWRRFSPIRTLAMPIRLLEGSRGAEARARIKSLYGSLAPLNGWLLLVFLVGFKWVFYLSAMALVVILTPTEMVENPFVMLEYVFEELDGWLLIAIVVSVTTLATTVVEPFFGAGGFGVYIQRRIEREGWDLELRFRRLVDRVQHTLDANLGLLFAAGFGALLSIFAVTAPGAHAQDISEPITAAEDEEVDEDLEAGPWGEVEVTPELIPADDAQEVLDDIFAQSPFAPRTETRTEWVRIEEEEEEDLELPFDFEIPPEILVLLSAIVRVLMWMLAIGALGFVAWKIYTYLRTVDVESARGVREAKWARELVVDDEELVLPDDHVGEAARECWKSGRQRRALAMLLLASLLRFEERHKFRFPPGWTTTRCAQEVEDRLPEGPVLAAVARAFSAMAWAGLSPTEQEFDALTRRWEAVFEARETSS